MQKRSHCVLNVAVTLNVPSGHCDDDDDDYDDDTKGYNVVVASSTSTTPRLALLHQQQPSASAFKHRRLRKTSFLQKSRTNKENKPNHGRTFFIKAFARRTIMTPAVLFRWRTVHWGRFAWISVVFLLTASLLYSHMVTLDPCQQAQVSLEKIRAQSLSSDLSTTTPTLPKIIHQQWKTANVPNEDSHRRFGDWHAAWQDLFPPSQGYTHMLWTDEALREFMKDHYEWFLPVYDSYAKNIQRVDASRYFLLHHYGGLYADMDYEPLSSVLWHHLSPDRVSLLESPHQYNEHVQNALMASPPGHLFWNATFEQLIDHASELAVLGSTGPRLLDVVIESVPSSYTSTLPCENFQRMPTIENGASPWPSLLLQHIVAPLYPQKRCGQWDDRTNCQYGRHHNSVTWINDESWWQAIRAWIRTRVSYITKYCTQSSE